MGLRPSERLAADAGHTVHGRILNSVVHAFRRQIPRRVRSWIAKDQDFSCLSCLLSGGFEVPLHGNFQGLPRYCV